MPSKSRKQQRLFQAAQHGATFSLARQLRASMPMSTITEFASSRSDHPHKNLGKYLHPRKAK